MEQSVQMTKMWAEEVQIYEMDLGELHILSTKKGAAMTTERVRTHKQGRVESIPVQSDSQRRDSYGKINNAQHSLRATKHDLVNKIRKITLSSYCIPSLSLF